MRQATNGVAAAMALLMATGAVAQEIDYGSFDGYVLRVKLIGGAQYEPLYAEIPKWTEMTGATVDVLSRKNHFELDREIKQDIAAGTLDWCVGSNHTSFAPQYGGIYADLNDVMSDEVLGGFQELALQNSTVDGRLVQLPRHSDISNLYYQKSLYEDQANKDAFMSEYGYALAPPETWDQFGDQAKFFADAPNFYGTQYVGKDEAITGRFYELLVAEGGALFDEDWNPTFNSEAGVRAVEWFKDLYDARAVPAGVLELPLGRHRSRLRFGHRRAESRLGRLGFVLQHSRAFEGRRRHRACPGAHWFQRQAHGLVGQPLVLDHGDLRQHGRGRFLRGFPDVARAPDG